jgi:hypothetical protein
MKKFEINQYTLAMVVGDNRGTFCYNAHPKYHGEPWYDWSLVYLCIENEDGQSNDKYYPLQILEFVEVDGEAQEVVQCATKPLDWMMIEEKFIV